MNQNSLFILVHTHTRSSRLSPFFMTT